MRRELRWLVYGGYKDAAMDNALNGLKLRGVCFALLALLVDPREVGGLFLFLRLLRKTGPPADGFESYSTAEQLKLSSIKNLQ